MTYPVVTLALVLGVIAGLAETRTATRQVWAGPGVNTLGAPSPDGRYLSFVDVETGELAIRDLVTGAHRRLTTKGSPHEFAYFSAISPDSRQIACAWFNDQKFYDLRVVNIDGSKPRILYRNEEVGFVQPCAWSPDGKQILTLFFRRDNISQLVLVSAADGSVRVLKSLNWVYPKKMDVSPDGRFIVYDSFARDGSPKRDIFVLSTDARQEWRLVEHPADDLFPLWTPDGKGVLFASDRGGTIDAWRIAVADGKPQGSPELVKRNLGRFLPMGITRKGEYYYGLRTGTEDVYSATLDPTTGRLVSPPAPVTRRSTGLNSSPEWSPDGQHLAYFSRLGSENYGEQSRVIVIRSLQTGEERELAPKLAHVERVRWSPDGRHFLAGGSDRHSRSGLYRIDILTGEATPVVLDESAGFRGLEGVWSSDGKAIVYARGAGIYWRDLETRREKDIHQAPSPGRLRNLALSPDGARLAFARDDALLVMPLSGGTPRELLPLEKGESISVAWARDGSRLLVSRAGKLWRVPLEGGPAQKVEMPAEVQGGISIHPDARRIAFTAGKISSEVWVMENFLR